VDNSKFFHLNDTPIRYSKLIGLKWTDIDWERGMVRILQQLQYFKPNGISIRNSPRTRSGNRSIGYHAKQHVKLND